MSGVVSKSMEAPAKNLIDFFAVTVQKRKEILLDAFTARRTKGLGSSQTPFSTFVKKLQESLTRMESFDVVTVAQGIDGQLMVPVVANMHIHCASRLKTQLPVLARATVTTSLGRW